MKLKISKATKLIIYSKVASHRYRDGLWLFIFHILKSWNGFKLFFTAPLNLKLLYAKGATANALNKVSKIINSINVST